MLTTKQPFLLLLLLLVTAIVVSGARPDPDTATRGTGGGAGAGGSDNLIRLPRMYDDISNSNSNSSSNVIGVVIKGGEGVCEETYGFLPCTTSWIGNMFLILVYGYLMFMAATYLSAGSELLLEILGPGLVGGLFLPILGALPDGMLILVSGLSGSPAEAQSQVSVGMGLLAGSTVMLLTVIWGTCIIVGKCDMDGALTVDGTDTRGFSLSGSGVSTDLWTSYAARIMVISVIPFLVVQLPQALNSNSGKHLAVLFSLILSLVMLVSYCLYQVYQPSIQMRKLDYVKRRRVVAGFLKHLLHKHPLENFFNSDGSRNHDALQTIFNAIDVDGDNYLSKNELGAFIIGIQLDGTNLDQDAITDKLLKEFDTERHDDKIDLDEFSKGICKLLAIVKKGKGQDHNGDTLQQLDQFDEESKLQHTLLGDSQSNEEGGEEIEDTRKNTIKAVLFLVLGTIIAGVFADPLVDAVDNFSIATSIPSFFISFIFLPLATNSSEAVSAIIFASRKKRRSASLTFSELYGAATMNNVLCLSVFLALVYIRGLAWDFSSEVLVIFLVCVIMGAIGSFRTSFPLWTASIAFFLYPFSLVLVYVLDYIFGWS